MLEFRVKMVAALLSSGANPSLVTDPTPQFPGGCTAADLASNQGHEGLGAYLAEKALSAHFAAMNLSGNVTNPSARASSEAPNSENIESGSSEQEVLLKYSLAAYRNAADAADRIHGALRERSMRLHVKAAELSSSQEDAGFIIAALKIQKAYRNHNGRKMMKAAARIQGTYRTWQARKNFLNLRRHAIRIQVGRFFFLNFFLSISHYLLEICRIITHFPVQLQNCIFLFRPQRKPLFRTYPPDL